MKKIRLKDEYYWCGNDEYIEISDDVFAVMLESRRIDEREMNKRSYHKAHYSLDAGDDIEKEAVFRIETPEELYERKLQKEQFYAALRLLPDIQFKRIIAHFYQNMRYAEIAKIEGVSAPSVCLSVQCGLRNLEKVLKEFF